MVGDFILPNQLAEHRFEFGDAAGEVVDGLAFGVGETAVFEDITFGPDAHDAARDTDDGGVVGDGMDDDRAGADLDVVADVDVAEDFGAGTDDDAIAEGGVALSLLAAGAAEGDALVEEDVVTDFGGFADDYPGAVVDEKPAADGGSGMDLDAGEKAADLRQDARHERHTPAIQL